MKFRYANEKDVTLILSFIKRLAVYEKMLDEFEDGWIVAADIANLKFQRDCAEAKYKAALEAVNVYKLKIKSLEAQIEREWRG